MLVSHVENLRTGMELHRRMARADNVILAVPKGSKVAYEASRWPMSSRNIPTA